MATLQPQLIFKSNPETASTLPGPMSWGLSLSVTDQLSVDLVEHKVVEASTTLNNEEPSNVPILDGSVVGGGTETPGSVGCWIYMKNNSSTTGENIYIGIVAGGGSDTPSAPAASGTTALDEATNATLRTFTLLPGEFCFFPFDYTGDIHYEAATGTPQLEYWRFDRA